MIRYNLYIEVYSQIWLNFDWDHLVLFSRCYLIVIINDHFHFVYFGD